MISVPDRRKIVELINKARNAGARLASACKIVGITARTYQRWTQCGDVKEDGRPLAKHPEPENKLSQQEKDHILEICHKSENASLPPSQIVPRLADQEQYIASESTFYRVLHEAKEQNHRGYSQKPGKPEPPKGYRADGPNQVWTWDVTYLHTHIRGMFFYLYMIVDVFSRKIVGWEVYARENSENAAIFIQKAVWSEGCLINPPVLHADNGSAQKGFTLVAKMQDLGIIASYSRPSVSNDNPYSEALFRTCKYRPDYPRNGFATIEDARKWVLSFVRWYNHDHRHSAIHFVSPSQRHAGQDRKILEKRRELYEMAKSHHPERWSGKTRNWEYIEEVWLNPYEEKNEKLANSKKAA